jgi:hypothetical protein
VASIKDDRMTRASCLKVLRVEIDCGYSVSGFFYTHLPLHFVPQRDMIAKINVSMADLPRERWRLSEQNVQWARELIRRSVDEVGGAALY